MASVNINGTVLMHEIPPGKTPGFVYAFPMTNFFLGETAFTASSPHNDGLPYKTAALTPTVGTGAFEGTTIFTFSIILQSTVDATINAVTARWGLFIFGSEDKPRLICEVSELASFWLETTPTTINLYDLRAQQGNTETFPDAGGDKIVGGNLAVAGSASIGTSLAVGTDLNVAEDINLHGALKYLIGAMEAASILSDTLDTLRFQGSPGSTLTVAFGETGADTLLVWYNGTPEGVYSAPPGSISIDSIAGRLWLKKSGSSSTGWREMGYRNVPQNSKSAAYTTVLADSGCHILHPVADNNARTFTIDSNANVAFEIGTALTFINEINTVTISITSDTLIFAGTGATGSRTLAANGVATALKIGATKWYISGTGLT